MFGSLIIPLVQGRNLPTRDLSVGLTTRNTPLYQYYNLMAGGDEDSNEARSGLLTNGCSKSCDAEGRLSGSTLTHWPMKS